VSEVDERADAPEWLRAAARDWRLLRGVTAAFRALLRGGLTTDARSSPML
jgi:hypothetical protein